MRNALGKRRDGSVAVSTALVMPVILAAAILGVDFGYLTLQKRELQSLADLAAITAASNIDDAENQLLEYFALNGQNIGILTATGLKTKTPQTNGAGGGKTGVTPVSADNLSIFDTVDGYARFVLGRYAADPDVRPELRFTASASASDAVKVTVTKKTDLLLAAGFFTAPVISAEGTAAVRKVAGFSIGSRLASLDGGILNALLGGLLGTSLSLKAMDYEQLAKVDLELLSFLDALNIRLGLKALTYEDLLETDIGLGSLIDQLGKANGVGAVASGALNTIAKALNKTKLSIRLEEILALGPLSERPVGSADNLTVKASLLDIVSAAAVAANGGKQVGVDLGANLPGLAGVSLTIAIGEPPVGTPSVAVGAPGAIVRTAQTRVALNVSVTGLSAILGLKVNVPLYVEVANAEAQLAEIRCLGGSPDNASVKVNAVPGVAEIALGNVDTSAFINFGTKPRVTKAVLVDSLLLRAQALAHVTSGNLSKTALTFSPSDIASGKVRSVSTRDTLTSLVQSLLKNLDLEVNILFITLGTPTAVTAALADTLSLVTAPVDTLLYNLLLLLGVKIGEADVRVTGVSCQQPVLVQ